MAASGRQARRVHEECLTDGGRGAVVAHVLCLLGQFFGRPSAQGAGDVDSAAGLRRWSRGGGWRAFPCALFREHNADLALLAGLRVLFHADDDFVDDEDVTGREGADHGPEDRNGRAQYGDVDFEDAEDVDDGRVVGHIEDRDSASAVDAKGDHAAY